MLEVTLEAEQLEKKGEIMLEKVYQEAAEEQTENQIIIETIKIDYETRTGGSNE